jgi:hypothetical protein
MVRRSGGLNRPPDAERWTLRAVRGCVFMVIVALVAACSSAASPRPPTPGTATEAPAGSRATAVPATAGEESPRPTADASPAPTQAPERSTAPTAPPDDPGPGTPTFAPAEACAGDQAWIGLFGDGAICLDGTGWKTFDKTNSPIRIGQIKDVAACADGTTWISDSSGLVSTDGTVWMSHTDAVGSTGFEAIACDPKGGVWLGGYDTIGHYDGMTMTSYPVSNLGTAKYVNQVHDVALAPNGDVWVTTANSVARFDGTTWKAWEKGNGFTTDVFFEKVIVDTKGVVWAAVGSGFMRFDGERWSPFRQDFLSQVKPIALDGAGRLWVGTYSKGLAVFNGKGWIRYTTANSPLPSDCITALQVDANGRVWIGTDWGLAILDGTKWQSYHMSDSGLLDNEIYSLAVAAKGPPLPAPAPKQPGSLVGRLVKAGVAQAGLQVEACVQYIGMMYSGKTPCADQVFHKLTKTDADGRFAFNGLPVGKYGLALQQSNGKWLRLTDGFKIGDRESTVPEGGTFDFGDLEVKASD